MLGVVRGGIVLGVVGGGIVLGVVRCGGEASWVEGRRWCELLVIQLSHTNDAHHSFERCHPPLPPVQ